MFYNEDTTHKISSVPIMLHFYTLHNAVEKPDIEPSTNINGKMRQVTSSQVIHGLCIDNVCGSFICWSISDEYGIIDWQFNIVFTWQSTATLLPILFPNHPIYHISNLTKISLCLDYTYVDNMFIPYHCGILSEWLFRMIDIINNLIHDFPRFNKASLWIPHVFWPNPLNP